MWGTSTPSEASEVRSNPAIDRREESFGLTPVAAQGGAVKTLDTSPAAWTANDPATLGGDDALTVHGNDALAPTIVTDQPVRDVDLRQYTSLTATVRPGPLAGTDAPVRARFRLVHDASQPRRRRRGSRDRNRPADVSLPSITSRTFTTPQEEPIRLHWDLRGIDDRVLDSVRRLEIVFDRADRPAENGPYGRGATGVRGSLTVADALLSDSPDSLAAARLQNHWRRLELTRGGHEETVVETETGDAESGLFRFARGEVPYDFCIHEDGTHVFELDGVTYRFRDGMAAVERQ